MDIGYMYKNFHKIFADRDGRSENNFVMRRWAVHWLLLCKYSIGALLDVKCGYWWSIGYCYAMIGAPLDVKCVYWWSIGYCYVKIGALLNVKCGYWWSIGYWYAVIGAMLDVKCIYWWSIGYYQGWASVLFFQKNATFLCFFHSL